jgi:hypothetical protein
MKQSIKPEDSEETSMLAGLSNEDIAQVLEFKKAVAQMAMTEVKNILYRLELQADSVPPEKKKFVEALSRLLRERICKEDSH